jgi:Tripartite tricarboxylate transporter family receptor
MTVEGGLPGLEGTFWTGIVAPARTPASIVNRLNFEIREILKTKEVETDLAKLGVRPKIGRPRISPPLNAEVGCCDQSGQYFGPLNVLAAKARRRSNDRSAGLRSTTSTGRGR